MDGEVDVFLTANVSVDGENFGPDFGRSLVTLPAGHAKTFMRRGDARHPNLPPCSRDGKRCDAATDPSEETPPCCVDAAVATLRAFQTFADAHDVTWWADYGTLLGAAGGRFVWNDKDCDVGVLAEHQSTVLRMRQAFSEAGFRFSYAAPRPGGLYVGGDRVKVRYSPTHNGNTDVFFWHERGGHYHRRAYIGVDRYKGKEFPTDWLLPLTTLPFEDLEIPVPKEWRKLGEHRYGAPFLAMLADLDAGMDPIEAGRKHFNSGQRTDKVRR